MAMINQIPKIAFWAALIVTLYFALSPAPPVLVANDKSQHILAFATLTALFCWAYPKAKWFWVLGSLALIGGAIEIAQGIPVLNRSSDLADWYADVAAAALTIVMIRVIMWMMNSRNVRAAGTD
ncbi:MAG: teicoplanin resistance protein VanZ [Alphaproteobacteria bacterium]|nr:teicoplanin resistance protein VanZ [Alphaproteobacteria bacterium]MBU0863783.1 teicoplanin resistance protein VanZ [Alphaproteobacteria bacterium]MBU1825977.1 teicoplanin resistance protein VanZ [Alphaproteobacteria bacterium]